MLENKMSYRSYSKCSCQRCLIRGLFGPAILITVGILFLLSTLNVVDFSRSSPFLLIVIGGLLLAKHQASTEGHLSPDACIAPPPPPPAAANETSSSNSISYPGR